MNWRLSFFSTLAVLSCALEIQAQEFPLNPPEQAAPSASSVQFRKIQLTDKYYCDGINYGDFNGDGHTDIVAGPFWYSGPDFSQRHEFYPAVELEPAASPSNSMYSFVADYSGDGWADILVLGRVHLHQAFWYENPRGAPGHWKKHFVFERVRGESPTLVDINGDGRLELICHWDNRWGRLRPVCERPTDSWEFLPLMSPRQDGEWPQFYHGTGVGDVNGDGLLDLVLNDGWWEQPVDQSDDWAEHRFRFAPRGGAQMYVDDVDGDGLNDVITALDAHGWGVAWFKQMRTGDGTTFEQHTIMGNRSEFQKYGVAFTQPHALDFADINADGRKDIVVGKRMWAHGPTGDIEPEAAPVLYWFRREVTQNGVRFVPELIDDQSGVGVQVIAHDVTGDGRMDVLTASKLGSFVFCQEAGK